MRADFHVHTDISDGSLGLRETIQVAKENEVTHMAITNHDTVKGLKEAIKEGDRKGIIIIPGIEISAYDFVNKKKVHILGYNFELEGKNIRKLCDPILERRNENSIRQIDILKINGYKINTQNILRKSVNSEVIYKQHIMAELIEKGYTDEIYSDLYKKLFKKGGICSGDIEYVDVFEAVKAIKADNGIAVLAHPGQLDSYGIIDELVAQGLDGIELNHMDHTEEDVTKIKEYSDKYGLILTGGSDFHGEYGSSIKIGEITAPNEYISIFYKDAEK
ncbi:PHP domain-containing protein [Clostridium sp. BL-8]|uniref:PHP domain-containing protein n=1 Tax=Clostridium sp. BL-8 TaxID=349938 RepID=UPI00098CB4FE|nr:PHP domain-containing protein [Clostridium sp. BL-8]OOM78628.1 PHP domain protein [Clostridium sp. BL-8]